MSIRPPEAPTQEVRDKLEYLAMVDVRLWRVWGMAPWPVTGWLRQFSGGR